MKGHIFSNTLNTETTAWFTLETLITIKMFTFTIINENVGRIRKLNLVDDGIFDKNAFYLKSYEDTQFVTI